MGGIYVDNGKEVLFGIPSPPPNFLNVSENVFAGIYIVGHDKFLVKDVHVVGVLRRSVGPSEEFLLGVLSVFLIAVVSEIVQVILMRTRRERRLSPMSVVYACLVDELSHFRNIWSHLSSLRRQEGNDRRQITSRQRALASLVVVGITLALFVVEVAAVVLTQPITVSSTEKAYNIKGVHPIGTSRGVARLIRRVAGNRICVSPIMTKSAQTRNFMVSACSLLEKKEDLTEETDVSNFIKVSSWYHRGGVDHNITFGEAVFHLRLRAELFLDAGDGGARRVLFQSRDNAAMDHAKYIHERFIYSSMEWACNKPFSSKSCEELVQELKTVEQKQVEKEIVLWRGKRGDITEKIKGLVTTFQVGMNSPYQAVNSGIRELYASAILTEVEEEAEYQNVLLDNIEKGIAGLISEEGRVAGVYLLLIIFVVLLIILFVVRLVLKPMSVARMMIEQVKDDAFFVEEANDGESNFSWTAMTVNERSQM